jgi:hypothetical protein
MMAMSDARDEPPARGMRTMALSALLGLILLFSLGAIVGTGVAWFEPGSDSNPATVGILVGIAVAAAALSFWGLLRLKPWAGADEPMSPKTRKARNLLYASAALGAVIGAVLALGTIDMGEPFGLFSNGPLSRAVVIPILAVWLLVVPVISWQWHRSVDEHEAEAYKFGGIAALYLYAFVTPAWWLAWRAGLVPAPDIMVIYLAVIVVMTVGWFWRRNR